MRGAEAPFLAGRRARAAWRQEPQIGPGGRTRTRTERFLRPLPLLLGYAGEMVGSAGLAPALIRLKVECFTIKLRTLKLVGQARLALATSRIRSEPSAADLLPVKWSGMAVLPRLLSVPSRGYSFHTHTRKVLPLRVALRLIRVRSAGDYLLPTGAKNGGWPG